MHKLGLVILIIGILYSCSSKLKISKNTNNKSSIHTEKFIMPQRSLKMDLVLNEKFLNRYENNGFQYSALLTLNKDSTFIYSYFYEIGHALTVGTYKEKDNYYTLNWDSLETIKAYRDTTFLKQTLKVEGPKTLPNKIKNVVFYLQNDTLKFINE